MFVHVKGAPGHKENLANVTELQINPRYCHHFLYLYCIICEWYQRFVSELSDF